MKRIATLDLETDPFKHLRVPQPFALGFFDGIIYQDFYGDDCVAKFLDWIKNSYDTDEVVIYAHNGGRFDFHYLLQYFEPELVIINGSIVKAKIGNIEFRDSYFILPVALKSYKKEAIDYRIFEKDERWKHHNEVKIREYLKSDCIYLHEWVSKFIDRYGQHLTLASASFAQLKETGYVLEHSTASYDEKFRGYYYGGRTQVFQGGKFEGAYSYFDINSAYPYAMLNLHPWGNRFRSLSTLPENGSYFATIDAISYGALPFRCSTSGRLSFPNSDEIRTFKVSGWEIQAGLETGTLEIVNIQEVLQHEQAFSFSSFVNKFYSEKLAAKKAGDKDQELFVKLILNSCYGKFALNPEKYQHFSLTPQGYLPDELVNYFVQYSVDTLDDLRQKIMDDDSISDRYAERLMDSVCSWHVVADTPFGITIWSRNDPNDRYYNVATAASITGYVRAMLWRAICNSKDVLYCDTDSIICGGFNEPISDELGAWKKEADLSDIWIGGKKLYAAKVKDSLSFAGIVDRSNPEYSAWLKKNWKLASKGSRLTHLEIIDLVEQGSTIKWKNQAPSFSLRYGPRFVDRDIKVTYE